MDYLKFIVYFLLLRLNLAVGRHRTDYPIGLRWRWRHWDEIKGRQRYFEA